jgi:hypothetical protein
MKQPKRPVFKGLRRFSYADEREELKAAQESLYFLWWSYLQLSKDYWWVCQQQGETLDGELRGMWQDFGDVYQHGFNTWWSDNGKLLFAEQAKFPHVRKIDDEFSNLSQSAEGHVIVQIPLNLTERTISRQVLAIMRSDPNRKIKPVSKTKRPLCKLRGIRKAVLIDAQDVWCLNYLVEMAKQPNARIGNPFNQMTSQQIGSSLRLVRSCMPKPTDGEEVERKKRNGMKVGVSRMLSRANALIANAEIGIFPSTASVTSRRRWTEEQQKALDAAIAAGKWCPSGADEVRWRQQLNLRKPLPG